MVPISVFFTSAPFLGTYRRKFETWLKNINQVPTFPLRHSSAWKHTHNLDSLSLFLWTLPNFPWQHKELLGAATGVPWALRLQQQEAVEIQWTHCGNFYNRANSYCLSIHHHVVLTWILPNSFFHHLNRYHSQTCWKGTLCSKWTKKLPSS